MQRATPPPWLWPAGALYEHKLRALDYYRALARQRPRLTLYTYGGEHRLRFPFPSSVPYKVGGWSGRAPAGPGPARPAGPGPAGGWERYPLDYPLDPLAAPPPPPPDLTHLPGRASAEWVSRRETRAALLAWLLASALVLLALALVRAVDRCLAANLLYWRRRSDEWPTANVRATSLSGQTETSGTVPLPGAERQDPPPPYCECAAADKPASGPPEEPPAYSDTYVHFSNKDGLPSVLVYSRRRAATGRPAAAGPEPGPTHYQTDHRDTETTTSTEIAARELRSNETDANHNRTDMNSDNATARSFTNHVDTMNSNSAVADSNTNHGVGNDSARTSGNIDEENATRTGVVLV